MKRIASLVALAFLGGAVLAGDTVTSVNVVGYVKVSVPPAGGLAFVGLNFESMDTGGDGGMTARELFGTNQLKRGARADQADQILMWKPSMGMAGGYMSIYQHNDKTFRNVSGNTVTNPVFYSGDGFWIQSARSVTLTNTITLLGNVSLSSSMSLSQVTGLQQFANPYPTDFDINGTNVDWEANGATGGPRADRADQIFIWVAPNYKQYFLKSYTGRDLWHNVSGGALATDAIIKVGQGAWYQAKGTFTNRFTRPFNLD